MNNIEIKQLVEQKINDSLFDEALELINKYKNEWGNDEDIASMEAIIYIYCKEYAKSLEIIKSGLKCNSLSSDLYYTLGNIYEFNNEINRAYICYEQAISLCQNDNYRDIMKLRLKELESKNNMTVNNVSFVILTYNQLEYTKICINSIRNYCNKGTYEIIVVDNNSVDGTVEWLKEQKDIKAIFNKRNEGFPRGCNQGIEIAEKNNDIFLLNNDTVMMRNSLFNMRMALYSESSVGAVGAISNRVSNYQQVDLDYNNFDQYIDFANKNNITDEELYEDRIKLIGFAMLLRREVLDKVGNLDERFTPGNFEDDDLSYRIIQEGYRLILAKDSYIHHFGSVSFGKDREKYNEIISMNRLKFEEKWGVDSSYSSIIRFDILGFINNEKWKKIRVLEVGCACGATSLKIKDLYPNAEIYGIEINKDSASIASKFMNIETYNIEEVDLNYEEKYFDYIIFADVLEHLYNPKLVLEKVNKYLKDDGSIITSIPNIMHYSVIMDLLNGNFTYTDAGILDRTHIRFFTLNEINKLFVNSGYNIVNIFGKSIEVTSKGEEFINKLKEICDGDEKQFGVYQYLIESKKNL